MFEKVFLIIIGVILTIGGPFALYKGITLEIKKVLPPGYSFLCNADGKYKWTGRGFTKSYAGSKQAAIDSAWSDYNQGEFTECDGR